VPGSEEGNLPQRLQQAAQRVVVAASPGVARFQGQRRIFDVPEMTFKDEPLGDGPGFRFVAGQLLGRERVEGKRRQEDEQAGQDGAGQAGDAAAHQANFIRLDLLATRRPPVPNGSLYIESLSPMESNRPR
jgi:hypothetical protein